MTAALEDGNVDVVRMLVQKRLVMMKTYLTKRRLGDLYKLVKHANTLPYNRSICSARIQLSNNHYTYSHFLFGGLLKVIALCCVLLYCTVLYCVV